MTCIRAVASALPPQRVSSDTVAAWCDSDAAFLTHKVGIEERRFLAPEASALELAAEACRVLLAREPLLHPQEVGLCLFVGQVQDQLIPHSSALLQHRIGLPESCACFDMGLACSGYVYALSAARGIMQAEDIEHALVVTCDPYSRIMGRDNRDTVPLFGDAATATWLSLSGPGARLGRADMGTSGAGAGWLHCAAPSQQSPFPLLTMNGRAIFQFAVKHVPTSIQRCLQRNALREEDISLFILHQANAFMLENIRKAMGISAERCPVTMRHVGNTVASSIPLTLEDCLPQSPPGSHVILSGFGGGLSWASISLTMTE